MTYAESIVIKNGENWFQNMNNANCQGYHSLWSFSNINNEIMNVKGQSPDKLEAGGVASCDFEHSELHAKKIQHVIKCGCLSLRF